MAANVEKLLLKIKADLADLKQLQVELATVRKETKETESSINSAFGNVAKIFGAAKLKGVFDSAVADARQLEKTILGLQATARLTGNNFRELNAQVKNLASDGVLSIDQASQSMKVLLAQGVQADKAFQLVDAAKKVGAFNNIVGNTGQSVQDFIKFMQTGSAELAENLDPSLVKVIKSLGGYERVANDAAAKQKLVNAVIEKGKNLSADYSKFLDSGAQAQVNFDSATLKVSQTFGEKLAPAYNAAQNALAKLLNLVADFIGAFDSTSVSIVAGTAFIVVALNGIGGALGLLSAKAATAWAAILGPVALIVAALGAIALGVNAVYQAYKKGDGVKLFEEKKALEEQIAALEKAGKKTQELVDAKEKLKATNKALTEQYDVYLKKLGLENASYETKLALLERIDSAEKRLGGKDELAKLSDVDLEKRVAELKKEQAEFPRKRAALEGSIDYGIYKLTGGTPLDEQEQQIGDELFRLLEEKDARKTSLKKSKTAGTSAAKYIEQRYQEAEQEMLKALGDFEKTVARINARERSAIESLGAAPNKKVKGESDSQFAERLKRFEEEEKRIRDAADVQRASAGKRADESLTTTISALRQSQAEFIEDRTTAELEALKQKTIQEEGNVFRLLNAKQISEEEAEKQLQKIREANAIKTAVIQAESFNRTLQAADTFAKGFSSLVNAKDLGGGLSGIGGVAQGLGGLSERFAPLGKVGAGFALLGGITSTLQGLFGKSDEERRREAEEQKLRDEAAKALLQLQANYQKSLLELQEAQANLPFQELRRKLRLADIEEQQALLSGVSPEAAQQTSQAKKLALISGTLATEGQRISADSLFAGTDTSAAGLTKFLTEREAEAPLIKAAESIISNMQSALEAGLASNNFNFDILTQARDRIASLGLSPQLTQAYMDKIGGFTASKIEAAAQKAGGYSQKEVESNRNSLRQWYTSIAQSIGLNLGGDTGGVDRLLSETRYDTTRGEELLSLLEQQNQIQLDIKKSTGLTAENTKKLDLLDPRKLSFIDLVRNSVFSQGLKVDFQKVQLPTAVSSTILASSTSPAVPSDTLAAMRRMVDLMDEANDYLAVIAENTNKNSTDDVDISDNRLIGRINSIKGRSIS
jgi:hypothetical protein